MRHPLRAVTPPVKSQHINSTRRSQITTTQEPRHCKILPATLHSYFRSSHTFIPPFTQCTNHGEKFPTPCHRNRHSFLLDSPVIPWVTKRAKIWPLSDAACSFGRRHLPGFPKPEDNIHTWLQESSFFLHASHTVSKGFRRGQGLLFFSAAKPHCLTSLQNSVRLFGSWNEAYKVLNRVLASSLSITQKPWGSSHPLHKDPHTYPRAFSVIVHRLEARGKTFPSFRAILQSSSQNLC